METLSQPAVMVSFNITPFNPCKFTHFVYFLFRLDATPNFRTCTCATGFSGDSLSIPGTGVHLGCTIIDMCSPYAFFFPILFSLQLFNLFDSPYGCGSYEQTCTFDASFPFQRTCSCELGTLPVTPGLVSEVVVGTNSPTIRCIGIISSYFIFEI